MEIQALKLLIQDADLAGLVKEVLPDHDSIEDLQVRLTPEGVLLAGQYPTGFGFKVPFETVWQVTPAGSIVETRLASVKVAGLPGNLLRGALMRMIRDTVEDHVGISVEEETIRIDVPAVAKANGANLQITFTAIRMSLGTAVVVVG